MLPHERRVAPAIVSPFVDVIPGVEDEVELLGRKPAERGEVSGLEVAAAAQREAQLVDTGAGGRRRLGAPDLADFTADAETIEILAARLETVRLDTDAVTELGPGNGRPFRRQRRERAIPGNLPADFDVDHRHAAARQWLRREPRPQDHAVRPRLAGRDAERKRIVPEQRLRDDACRQQRLRNGGDAELPGDVEQLAPRQPLDRAIVEPNRISHVSH